MTSSRVQSLEKSRWRKLFCFSEIMSAYKKSLRNNRVLLLRELPDVEALISTVQLKPCFTRYEKSELLAFKVPSDRAAKLLDLIEGKDYEVYEKFLTALRPFKPSLASTLERTEREIRDSSAASSPCSNGSSAPPCEWRVVWCSAVVFVLCASFS